MWYSVLAYQKYMLKNKNVRKVKLTEGKKEVAMEKYKYPLLGNEVGQWREKEQLT